MGYRTIASSESPPPPSDESSVWTQSFSHYASFNPGEYGSYTEFPYDITFPVTLSGDETIEIELACNGDNGGDLMDLWIADLSGNGIAWPLVGNTTPWRNRITIFRSPEESGLGYQASTVEGFPMDGSSLVWSTFGWINYGGLINGLTGLRIMIGLQPFSHTAWARMTGLVKLYRTDI